MVGKGRTVEKQTKKNYTEFNEEPAGAVCNLWALIC